MRLDFYVSVAFAPAIKSCAQKLSVVNLYVDEQVLLKFPVCKHCMLMGFVLVIFEGKVTACLHISIAMSSYDTTDDSRRTLTAII